MTAPFTAADYKWANELADAMVTSTLAMSANNDRDEVRPLYEAVRALAFEVRTDDGLGQERWLLAMYYLAARSAGLLERVATLEAVDPSALWQAIASAKNR